LVGTDCTAVQYDWWVPTVQLSVCSSEVCFRPEDSSSTTLQNTDTNTVVLPSVAVKCASDLKTVAVRPSKTLIPTQ